MVEYKYDAWGDHVIVLSDSSNENLAKANPFRYRGYYYDEETGLYYLKSRYYDPETGRFLNADDISYLDPETINGLNLYAYCGNNPVMNVDPNGTFFSLLFALLIGAVVGTVVSVAGTFVGDVVGNLIDHGFDFSSWQFSNWQTYTGAAIGGFIGGALGVAFPGSFVLVAGVAGAISTFATDVLEYATGVGNHTWTGIFIDTVLSGVISAAFGKLTQGFVVKGINAGRNSFQQVFKSGVTKAWRYGYKMSLKTAGKGFIYLGLSSFNVGWLLESIWGGVVG